MTAVVAELHDLLAPPLWMDGPGASPSLRTRQTDTADFGRHQLEQLYLELERPMYNVVYRWVWQPDDAAEIVQEAFVRLWDKRDTVRPDEARALVYKIALNLASNRRRSAKVWRWARFDFSSPAAATTPNPHESLAEAQRKKALHTAVERLPEKLRRTIMLTEFSELGYAEVAAILGIPEGTVGSRRNRALALLRDALEHDHG